MTKESIKKMKELADKGREKKQVLHFSEAFKSYSVNEETHKGKIEYWTQGEKKMKCEIGDIVLVNNFSYQNDNKGSLHSFVVVNINKNKYNLVTLDYLCFLISSNTSKNNTNNPNYPYNEPIAATPESGLKEDSHVNVFDKLKRVQ